MKKIFVPVFSIVLLSACNTNNGGGNATNNVAGNPTDSAQTSNKSDTTPTTNNNAYNTTDTGMGRGSTTDSSGHHSRLGATSGSKGKKAGQ